MSSLAEHFDVVLAFSGLVGAGVLGLLGLQYRQLIGKVEKLEVRIERHMDEEENQVWTGIRELSDKLAEMHAENIEAHGQIRTEYGQRLATIEARMPNGEITEMLGILRGLAKG
jgi:hypothetical protein